MSSLPHSSIRRATPADEPVLRVLQGALDEQAPALLDAALSETLGECFVACADTSLTTPTDAAVTDPTLGVPVGYVLVVDGSGASTVVQPVVEHSVSRFVDGPTRHVAELVVSPNARRQGYASALLTTLFSRYPNATVTLTVAETNEAARALYERFGFETVRVLPNFFGDEPGRLLARRPGSE